MADRHIRRTVIQAKIETTPGTWTAPAAADALLISDVEIDYLDQNVDRDLIRAYLGGSEQLVGTRAAKITFSCEIAGPGAAGTAPAWGKLLRACGMAETAVVSSYVSYNPVSEAFESLSIKYVVDGVGHNLKGARGTVDMSLVVSTRPLLKFTFVGVENTWDPAITPAGTLTAWKVPVAISDVNTGDIRVGCTYAAGVLTGGTAWPSRGLELSLGTDPKMVSLLGSTQVDITSRAVTGKATFVLDDAAEVQLFQDAANIISRQVGLVHGKTAGNIVGVYMPNVQFMTPKYVDVEGRVGVSVDLRVCPANGNDELIIWAK